MKLVDGSFRAFFPGSYQEADERFESFSLRAGAALYSYENPVMPALRTQVAVFGSAQAESLLIVSSGTHGVEGYCGSGAQAFFLNTVSFGSLPEGVRLVLIHALNPYGFFWERRVTEGNIDLNRNWLDFSRGAIVHSAAYEEIHEIVVPTDLYGPSHTAADREIETFIRLRGQTAYERAICQGQYAHSDGVFYGGTEPTWSRLTLEAILEQEAVGRKRIAMIDIHSGLGPTGQGEVLIVDPRGRERALRWYGRPTWSAESISAASRKSDARNGSITGALAPFQDAEVTMVGLEFGTVPLDEMLEAVRLDNLLHLHRPTGQGTKEWRVIKDRLRRAFFPADEEWCKQVALQTEERIRQALEGLCEPEHG